MDVDMALLIADLDKRVAKLEREKLALQGAVETLKDRCDVLEDKLFPKPKGEPVA